MKRSFWAGVIVATLGIVAYSCASPAADYVHAEKSAWDQFDPYLDKWIDAEPTFDLDPKDPDFASKLAEKKKSLHMLNQGRRARVDHAIASVGT